MKIGVTERGDGGINLTWLNRLDEVDGAIIITKNLTDECINAILANKDKLIVHCTCTGHGGTAMEPNVPRYKEQLTQLQRLIWAGFPVERVVLRVDPLIPTGSGLSAAQQVIDYAMENIKGLKRIRVSLIDMYPHARERFQFRHLTLPYGDNFAPSANDIFVVNGWGKANTVKYPDVTFEACAEKGLYFCEQVGCVSQKDLDLLGLGPADDTAKGKQRKGCLCLGCKTELLDGRHPCKHQCAYCYWR